MKIMKFEMSAPTIGPRGGLAIRGSFCVETDTGLRIHFSADQYKHPKWTDEHTALFRLVCSKVAETPQVEA